jgi:hypothetical protein
MVAIIEVLSAVLALVLGLFGIEHGKRKDAEAKVLTAEADTKDSVLATKQDGITTSINTEQAIAAALKYNKLSQAETEDFLKKL